VRRLTVSASEEGSTPAHIYGVKPVLEALRAGVRPLERILLSDTAQDSRLREIGELARLNGTPVRRIKREEIERFAGREC
jgi:tRNA G18 (ribose-2'-O)-methylase SpoU